MILKTERGVEREIVEEVVDSEVQVLEAKAASKLEAAIITNKNEITQSSTGKDKDKNNINSDNDSNVHNNERSVMLCFPSMWKEIYLRQRFAPPPPLLLLLKLQQQQQQLEGGKKEGKEEDNLKFSSSSSSSLSLSLCNYYVNLIQYKRTLLQNLIVHPKYRMDRLRSSSLDQESKSKSKASTKSPSGSSSSSNSTVFALPDSFFHFVPITPNTFKYQDQYQLQDEDRLDDEDDDPPPVDFVCTSFVFTNSNTSPEMIYLDPYNGTMRIVSNIMDHDSKSMLEMKRAEEIQTFKRDYELLVEDAGGEEERGEGIEREARGKDKDGCHTMNHSHCRRKSNPWEEETYDHFDSNREGLQRQQRQQKQQCRQYGENEELFTIQDYFHLNLNEYFGPEHDRNNIQRGNNSDTNFNLNINGNLLNNDNLNDNDDTSEGDELIIDWLGIDSHSIIDVETNEILGSMVCAARSIIVESQVPPRPLVQVHQQGQQQRHQQHVEEEEKVVTEILAWKKYYPMTSNNESYNNNTNRRDLYQHNQMICRFDSSPYYIDICPVNDCVYASFEPEDWMVDLTNDDILISTGNGSGGAENDNGNHGANYIASNGRDSNTDDGDDDDDDDDSFFVADRNPISSRDRKIVIYPLLKSNDNDSTVAKGGNNDRKYFPPVEECIVCNHPVTCFMVDPHGDKLVVGTVHGTLEIWDVSQTDNNISQGGRRKGRRGAKQIECIDMSCELRSVERNANLEAQAKAAFEDVERVSSSLYLNSMDEETEIEENVGVVGDFDGDNHESDVIMIDSDENDEINHSCDETSMLLAGSHMVIDNGIIDEDHDSIMEEQDENGARPLNEEFIQQSNISQGSLSLPQCKPSRGFSSIEIPRHIPIEKSGFVTVQHHHNEGTTLSLWQMHKKENRFQLTSLINLPLAPQPKPQVSYDGKRIIVFGQDHVGLIILVYKVTSSWEDFDNTSEELEDRKKSITEDSGGVINLRLPARIEYVNRIRHCGLGGLEYYDSMFLSVNERFIAVNTKTGNLFGGLQRCEGLFVIDLENHPPASNMHIV